MAGASPLVGADEVLVDANVFFAIGRSSNRKYGRFRREVERANTVLTLPQRVVGELGGPETDRVQTALDEGWAEIVDAPDVEDGDALAASDIARRTIASETGTPEHEVEKADTVLAGLAVQYLRDRPVESLVVLTDDIPARKGITNAAENLRYADAMSVYGVRDIIGDDPADSMNII
jgi:hypothetical protein